MSLAPDAALRAAPWGPWAATATAVPLVWRRRAPLAVLVVVAVFCAPAWALLGARPAYPVVLVLVAALALALDRRGPQLRAGVVVAAVALFALCVTDRVVRGAEALPTTVWAAPVVTGSMLAAVVLLGTTVRGRREQVRLLEERAERLRAERDQRALIAVAAERARIARELHDVVAHALTVVVRLGDGLAARAARSPDAPADPVALAAVTTTARQALGEMRALLGVLGSDGGVLGSDGGVLGSDGGGHGAGAVAPPLPGTSGPGPAGEDGDVLDGLDAVVAGVRAAGVPVRLTRQGQQVGWSPGVRLAVHRVATEALTNVLDHAGLGVRVEVAVRSCPVAVELVVDDDGVGLGAPRAAEEPDAPPVPGRGRGLLGMRERAAAFGGSLEAGPREGGGWRVRAVVPLASTTAGPVGQAGAL